MMDIYLPIAETSINMWLVIGLGAGVGMMSGIFGVGGGFLMTPLLIFLGIPPVVAVATESNQIVASSVSGALAHWKRNNVDIKMGIILLLGGLIGSTVGVWIFALLRSLGQIDFIIKISYVALLSIIGAFMFIESAKTLAQTWRSSGYKKRKLHQHYWMHGLPFKMRFHKSKLYISAIVPFTLGILVGILSAVLGVGGGFVMVPAMIYLIGMPTSVVIGTSLFQIIFVTANATFFQSYINQTVDITLALLLIVGGVIGAQVGARMGAYLPNDKLRIFLSVIVLVVAIKLLLDLTIEPANLYDIVIERLS